MGHNDFVGGNSTVRLVAANVLNMQGWRAERRCFSNLGLW